MFEVGFSELVLIMLIALVVLGPEKLPKLAADVGRWVGRARAMARQLRSQLDQEVQIDEMLREKPAPAPPPSYPPPNQTPAGYGAAGAAAATGAVTAGADISPDAASASVAGAETPDATTPTARAAGANGAHPVDATDPVGAMQDAPRSREAAYAAYVAQTQAEFQNPPAVGPGAPGIGAPTDDAHSHGEPHSGAGVNAPAADTTEPDRAHGHRQS